MCIDNLICCGTNLSDFHVVAALFFLRRITRIWSRFLRAFRTMSQKKGVHTDWMEKKNSSERLNITCSHFPTTERRRRTNKTTRRTKLNNMCSKFFTLFIPAGMLSFHTENIQIGCTGKTLMGLVRHASEERNVKDPASSSQVRLNYDTNWRQKHHIVLPEWQRLKQSGCARGRGW